MDRAIHHMGGRKGDFDITNSHLYGALASGVEANMGYIDDRINDGWELNEGTEDYEYHGGDGLAETTEFLSEIMADDGAAERVRNATFEYVNDHLGGLDVDDNGMVPRDDANSAGRMLGVAMESELAAMTEVFEEDTETASNNQKFVNFVVGYAPYVGDLNGVLDFSKNSVGETLYPSPDPEDFKDDLAEVEDGGIDSIEGLGLDGRDIDSVKAGMFDAGNELN
jgi:hypothetical protein